MSLAEGAAICGVPEADIVKAAEWIAKPKEGGARRRTVFPYEKGIIWGNDNYRTIGALVNIGLATGNIGRPGGGVVRLGGHQEGYMRPSDAHVGRPAAYIDDLLIRGHGKVHHIWANDHYKTTLNASEFKRVYNRRTNMVKEAMDAAPGRDPRGDGRRHRRGNRGGAASSRSISTSCRPRSANARMSSCRRSNPAR